MALITENNARKMLADGVIKEKGELHLMKNQLITPSAREFLTEKKISIKQENPCSENIEKMEKKEKIGVEILSEEYETLFGIKLTEKPEHMTHLRGNLLVFKDHPRIAFRGAIDSLESEIILVQIIAQKEKLPKMVDDLEEIIRFIRLLLRCEVSGEKLGQFQLQGLTESELRERSYHPSKYYGIKHFLPSYEKGEIAAHLNQLRTKTRETELAAYRSFKEEYGQGAHPEIIRGLNRLSSLFWIMMFRYLNREYDKK